MTISYRLTSPHLNLAFQRGELQPHNQPEPEETDDSGNGFPFEFEEMETPDVEYEDEYERLGLFIYKILNFHMT